MLNFLSSPLENRHYGLDAVRATSLLMILVVHCFLFLGPYYKLTPYMYFGVLAVELFFALSGFLIGTILLKVSEKGFTRPVLVNFWARRWMRTLPAYFTVVAIIMLVDGRFYWSFLFFLQNYVHPQLAEFPVSWTISLEEWFYLSFPIMLFVCHRLFASRWPANRIYLFTTLLYIAGPPLSRAILLTNGFDGNWDLVMRKSIFIRFDTIGYGLLLAWLYRHHEALVMHARSRQLALFGMLSLTGLTWWLFNQSVDLFGNGLNWRNSLLVFPGVNLVCFCAVAYALHFEQYRVRWLGLFMTVVSITSYSLYLVHFQIFLLFEPLAESQAQAWANMFAAIAVVFVAAFILNTTVERYFINRRDTWLTSRATSYQELSETGSKQDKTTVAASKQP